MADRPLMHNTIATSHKTTVTEVERSASSVAWHDRMARGAMLRLLSGLRYGSVTLRDDDQSWTFGDGQHDPELQATIRVHHASFYRAALTGGSVGAGERYIRGAWSCDDLTALTRIMLRNRSLLEDMDSRWVRLVRPLRRFSHWLQRNTKRGSRRNIMAHYDLGNDFFQFMLDETMTYSAGIFARSDSSLADASLAKYERIGRKLRLTPADHVLEIGSGWGGFAIHAADRFGCRVTTCTISVEQYEFARRRVHEAGLEDKVTILLRDYRDITGQFDKIVSIEMIEAVGHQYYDTFFETCSRRLKHNGQMLIQAITMPDQKFSRHIRNVDFIKRYVFPGSCIPSITALCESVTRVSDLRPHHLEDITPHYARTLAAWRRNVHTHLTEIQSLGYSEAFLRLWEFYLSYCEGSFAERYNGVVQFMLTKPGCREEPLLEPMGHVGSPHDQGMTSG